MSKEIDKLDFERAAQLITRTTDNFFKERYRKQSDEMGIKNVELEEVSLPEQDVVDTKESSAEKEQQNKMYCPLCGSPEYEESIAEVAENAIHDLDEVLSVTQQDDFSFFVAFDEVSLSEQSQMAVDLRNVAHFESVEFVGEYEVIIGIASRNVVCGDCGFEWQYTLDGDSEQTFQPHTLDKEEQKIESMKQKIEKLEKVNNRLMKSLTSANSEIDALDELAGMSDEPGIDIESFENRVMNSPNHAFASVGTNKIEINAEDFDFPDAEDFNFPDKGVLTYRDNRGRIKTLTYDKIHANNNMITVETVKDRKKKIPADSLKSVESR